MINQETDVLNPEVRARIIKQIETQWGRKSEAFRRYQCYKGLTKLYVVDELLKQFDGDTVEEMRYALSNIGVSKKVIDKLARVYKYGVERELVVDGEEIDSDDLNELAKIVGLDRELQKTNRFYKLFLNTLLFIRPIRTSGDPDAPMTIQPVALPPFLYDPITLDGQPQKAVGFVLTDFDPKMLSTAGYSGLAVLPGTDGRYGNVVPFTQVGDVIPVGGKTDRRYTFWTDSYHFVCNSQGEILQSEADGSNPIGELPFVNYCEDQDMGFFAPGGEELTDGAILVNAMITNINHIGITQGYGQLVVTGKDIPRTLKVGPNKAVRLTQEDKDDPAPTFEFKSANPPLDQLRALVDMQMALILTTNNLSTSGVSTSLKDGSAFPSGIAMLIDKSEAMEDIEDQRRVFQDNEPAVWRILAKWHRMMKAKGELIDPLMALSLPDDFTVGTYFNDPKPIETEIDRLTALQLKDALGIISKIDMIKADNPDLTDDMAQAKLDEIKAESVANTPPQLAAANATPDTAIPGENPTVAAIAPPRTTIVTAKADDNPRKGE